MLLAWRIRLHGGSVGAGLLVDSQVHLRYLPSENWALGEGVYFGRGVILDVHRGARFEVGPRTKIMHHVLIGAAERIVIGAGVQIAEFTSVRDSNHDTAIGVDMIEAKLKSKPISIGDGAWIGRGVAVLAGASVGHHSIVGANSVVNASVPENSVAVGLPARVVSHRG